MNKTARFFAGTTSLFALSTLYFAWQLNQRDTVPAQDPATAVQGGPPASAGAPPTAMSAASSPESHDVGVRLTNQPPCRTRGAANVERARTRMDDDGRATDVPPQVCWQVLITK
jgi:hypothetical protein